jgi:hypothetical protein
MINNFIILSLMSNTFDHTSQPTGNFVSVGSLAALQQQNNWFLHQF